MYTYDSLRAKMMKSGSNSITLKRSWIPTIAYMWHGDIHISMLGTDILTYYANGDIRLNSGGWRTVTTKRRMNDYLPNATVFQRDHEWYAAHAGREIPFRDGMILRSE